MRLSSCRLAPGCHFGDCGAGHLQMRSKCRTGSQHRAPFRRCQHAELLQVTAKHAQHQQGIRPVLICGAEQEGGRWRQRTVQHGSKAGHKL